MKSAFIIFKYVIVKQLELMRISISGLIVSIILLCSLSISGIPLAFAPAIEPYADYVVSYSPGPGAWGITADPSAALGAPEGYGGKYSVSLGTEGSIELGFDHIICDGTGDDLGRIWQL